MTFARHLGQVISILPLPFGTLKTALHFLHLKYLCVSLSCIRLIKSLISAFGFADHKRYQLSSFLRAL